jgi:hypothetical protein
LLKAIHLPIAMSKCDGAIPTEMPNDDVKNSAPGEIVRGYASGNKIRGMPLSEMVADKRALIRAPRGEHTEQCLLAIMLEDQSL